VSALITGFIAAAIALIAVAVALVATPLLRHRDDAKNSPIAATVAAVAIPALAVLFYAFVSNYEWAAPTQVPEVSSARAGALSDVVQQLEQRMVEQPGDVEGWLLLGRTYMQLQRFPDARRAYAAAVEVAPVAEAKLGLAEADILIDRINLGGEAGRLVEEVVAEQPDNPKALFYGGMVALFRGDEPTARDRWEKVLALSPPDNVREILERQLAAFGDESAPVAASAVPPSTGASDDDSAVAVNVTIDASLAGQVSGNDILFVLARRPGVPGPPIAAVRVSASNFPTTLSISDANTMIAGNSLTGLSEVEIVARISKSGGPIAGPGDLFGSVTWSAATRADRSVDIVIDQTVE
jgi:cytochrome c-type biogenesis protein CcmH